jgi:hypothetical protein
MITRASGAAGLASPIPVPRLEGIPEIMQPAFELGAKLQSEFVCLWCHRAQAWLNLPSRMATCKTPTDFVSVQGDFLNEMQLHYAQYVDGVLRDCLIEQDAFDATDEAAASRKGRSDAGVHGKRNAA